VDGGAGEMFCLDNSVLRIWGENLVDGEDLNESWAD
jgi:hypothetical protein